MKAKIKKIGRSWYAHTPFVSGVVDIETDAIGVGDTPIEAYNNWKKQVDRWDTTERDNNIIWAMMVVPLLVAGVLVWIFG